MFAIYTDSSDPITVWKKKPYHETLFQCVQDVILDIGIYWVTGYLNVGSVLCVIEYHGIKYHFVH